MSKHFKSISTAIALALMLMACAGSQISSSLPADAGTSVIPPSFALASDFPSDIVIADIDGMRSTAFIVSTTDPAGVIAIDIDASPMILSGTFAGLISPDGSGIPSKLVIKSTDEAFLLSSNSIICFNPTDGSTFSVTEIPDSLGIGGDNLNSDGSQASATVELSYPGGMASAGDKLFVSTANFIRTEAPALAAPGTVLVFKINADRSLDLIDHIVTTAHNPTGLSIRNGIELIITNSGALSIADARAVPESPSNVDIVDLDSLEVVATIPIGIVAASFHGVELTNDGSRGFLGSAAYGHVYEMDFINRQMLRGMNDPHVVIDGSDYITDVELSVDDQYLFAASFEQSTVYPFDLSKDPSELGDGFVIGYPAGVTDENPSGANTGAGPIAVRPGSRGTDYEGADLMILTGYPGTLVAVQSDAPAQAYEQSEDESTNDGTVDDIPTPAPPEGDDEEPCQAYAQSVHSINYGDGAGFGQNNFPDIVLGPPRGSGSGSGGLHVLTLGGSGEIVLDLGNCPVIDGVGDDFIVFENAFYIGGNPEAPFAEIGDVAVSEDGVNFAPFDCQSDSYPYEGCTGWNPVYSNPDNDISPFDVDEAGGESYDLADIGVARARYIRVRDVKGAGSGVTVGFDLDAIAVVNGRIEN